MKLLLHVCCAPCAISTIKEAVRDGYADITGYFYDPNIHPGSEHEKRKLEAEKYFTGEKVKFIAEEYNASEYFYRVVDFDDPAGRCRSCWALRMERVVSYAKRSGYEAFTTTLLESPYQDHEWIRQMCESLGKDSEVKFYYKDFRKGFKEAHEEARNKGIYCQNYCGCVFSIAEREERRKERKARRANA